MKYKIIYTGGATVSTNCDLEINGCVITDLDKYNQFLNHIELYIDAQRLDDSKILNADCKNLIESNIMINVFDIHKASTDVYAVKIDNTKSYIDEFIFIDGNNDMAMKGCESDPLTCSIYVLDEIEILIKFSKLVTNKITNSLLLFFGFTNFCNMDIIETDINDDSSVIFTNYIHNSVQSTNVQFTERQLFEFIYTLICCIANYGFFVADNHSGNIICFQDTTDVIYKIGDDHFYFEDLSSICIIDYQAKYKFEKNDNKYDINQLLNAIRSNCKNSNVLTKFTNQLRKGTIDELLNSLKENFMDVLIEPQTEVKTFEFKILK